MTQTQIDLCLYLILAIAVFLLIREVICWYFKINERLKLQKESNENQLEIIKAINNIETLRLPQHFNCRSAVDTRTSKAVSKQG